MSRTDVVELSCDRTGCTTPGILGRTWDEPVTDAETDGWFVDDEQLCPTHRPTDPEVD